MILLDTISTENIHTGPGLSISLCGARYNGIQQTVDGEKIVIFTDPVTSIALMLPEREVTIGTIWRMLTRHRREHFGIPQSA
jgi:hypothetical protein